MAMKRVFVQGSYDILNCGHCRSLKELHDKFGYVIVGLNSDELMMSHKGRVIIPFSQRKEILLSLRWVDEVVVCNDSDPKDVLKRTCANVFASVPEWLDRQKETIDWIKSIGGQFYQLTYYPDGGEVLSSTQIRERVKGAK
jgi:cytidyltransferase-like protein